MSFSYNRETNKSIDRILLRGSFVSFVLKIGGVLVAFLLQVALARLLDPKGFGDYVFVLTIVNFLVLLASLGLDKAAIKYLPQYLADRSSGLEKAFRSYADRLTLSAGAAASVLLVAVGLLWPGMDGNLRNCLFSGATMIIINLFIQLRSSYFQAIREIALSSYPQNILRPLALLLLVFVVSLFFQVSAVWAMLASVVSGLMILVYLHFMAAKKMTGAVPDAEIPNREWLNMAIPMMFISGLNLVMSQADIFLLGVLQDTTSAGIYSAATKLALLVTFVLTSANVIAAPMIAEFWTKKDMAAMQHLVSRTSVFSFFLAALICSSIYIFRDFFLGFYGSGFLIARDALGILLLSQVVNAAVGCAGYVMIMTGHQRNSLLILVIAAAINLILNVLLIPDLHMRGAALATFFSTLVMCSALAWYTNRIIGINSTFVQFQFLMRKKNEGLIG
ncbi:MAG TPA: flippase [Dongiaceae bacterium]|nr:flippase [Dongiaceae bacterium]